MCGIAGILDFGGGRVPRPLLEGMGACLRHRGPDEEGFLDAPGVGFAIERLKVIDLVTGSQPIYNETRDVAVVFNGEIYNYPELREELEKKGHRFSTQSDTETIVHLYEEHQEGCFQRLNGMFAVALWDFKRERLVLARDRAGIKPLFYGSLGGRLAFASEIKAILADPRYPREVDPDSFLDYLSYYYVSSPRTIYRDIRRLPPGQLLIAERGGFRLEKYWDLRFQPDAGPSLGDWEREFRDVLQRSVRRHLQSEVPVGVYLSGGLDSASIAAAASAEGSRLKTYTVGYAEGSYSELAEARRVAERFGTDHHEFVLGARQAWDLLPEFLRQNDEPHGDWSAIPNYFLSREVKGAATVVLSGSGGDELFGGYPTYLAAKAARLYRRLPEWLRAGVLEPAAARLPASHGRMSLDFMAKSFVRGAGQPLERAHQGFKEIFGPAERGGLLRPAVHARLAGRDPFSVFEQYSEGYSRQDWMDRLLYLDFKVFLPDCGLQVADITTSAHSLEGRVPFLDLEMMALAERVPWKWKVRGWTTKYLMRRAMRGRLPAETVGMKKKGFLVPGAPWIGGELQPLVREVVAQAEKELEWLFNFPRIHQLLEEHAQKKQDHARRISCLVSLFLWNHIARPSWNALGARHEGSAHRPG